jgi:hypothetical protein
MVNLSSTPLKPGPEPEEDARLWMNRCVVRRQTEQAMKDHQVRCICDKLMEMWETYRCLYCGVYLCVQCGERHFGMTRQEYRDKQTQHQPTNASTNHD